MKSQREISKIRVILGLVIMLGVFLWRTECLPVKAAELVASGTCGENASWVLCDDTLTISGTGEMYDYQYNRDTPAPWYAYRDVIKTAIIENTITTVGDYAFFGCSALENITLSDNTKTIGDSAFQWCGELSSLELPDGLTCIKDSAFNACNSIKAITIPDSVTDIGTHVFWGGDRINKYHYS